MAILLAITDRDVRPLRKMIRTHLGEEAGPVWIYPEMPDAEAVTMAVLWKHPEDLLAKLPNLQLVSSLGAGVEHILNDPALPGGLRITRIIDDTLIRSMRNYVVLAVLHIHKQLEVYRANQRAGRWSKPAPVERPLRIGVLGLGTLGRPIARFLAGMGFEVLGYSRSPRRVEGITCYSAADMSLPAFARRINTLICLLPGTPATEGILDGKLFASLPPGSFLINVARGAHLVEGDLLQAMDEGRIEQAWLDVFHAEPLPAAHPFWTRPGITVTPHIASITDQENAAALIAGNYRRMQAGDDLLYEVDREKGY